MLPSYEMTDSPISPGEINLYGEFRKHYGPRFSSAGLGIEFHFNQEPGIHFKTEVPPQYRSAIERGLREALAHRFPQLPQSTSIWITRVDASATESSSIAFCQAAKMVVEQAYSLTKPIESINSEP